MTRPQPMTRVTVPADVDYDLDRTAQDLVGELSSSFQMGGSVLFGDEFQRNIKAALARVYVEGYNRALLIAGDAELGRLRAVEEKLRGIIEEL